MFAEKLTRDMPHTPEIETIITEEFKGKTIAIESLKQLNSPFKMLSTLAVAGFDRIGADSVFIEPRITAYFVKQVQQSMSNVFGYSAISKYTRRCKQRRIFSD